MTTESYQFFLKQFTERAHGLFCSASGGGNMTLSVGADPSPALGASPIRLESAGRQLFQRMNP
jgi:hypothetical protein